ncbi:MAG TPA: PPC domain-containing protein [Verrucomicrobiales bacterium]|nr:PPC domain-containing protein [Verrucomicrobiales bacterium]
MQTGSFWLTQGSLHGATSESNEPVLTGYPNGPTAWWRWTAPVSGTFRVRTWGSEKTNMVSVYRGATLDTTRLVSFSSGHFERANSAEVSFSATAGETYSIQVLGADYAAADAVFDVFLPSRIQLSLTPSGGAAPANNNFANAQVVSGNTADVVVSDSGATAETGEPLDLPNARANSVWLSWTAPSNGVWAVDTQQGDHDTVTAVYTGSAVNSLTRLDFSDDSIGLDGNPWVGGGRVTFRATAGQTCRIQIQGVSLPGEPLDYGNVRVLLQPVQPPPNDDFSAAVTLSGTAPAADGWTTFATRETAEPAADPDESRSIWWKWTAPATGQFAVIQYEGNVDAYSGTAPANLVRLPFAPHSGTRISLGAVTTWHTVTAGATVWLRGTGSTDRVIFSLRTVQPPANDDFTDRKTLTGATVSDTVDMEYASWENNEPDTDALGPSSVWYRWTAPSTGRFVIDSKGSPSFTRVKIFTGPALTSLVSAGTEALYGFIPNAYGRVYLNAVSGTEYSIRLQRESFVFGPDHLNIRPAPPPANDNFSAAITMTGSAWNTTGSNVDATFENNEPINSLSDGSAFQSVWWKWTAPASGLFRVSTAGSSADTVLVIYSGSALTSLTKIAQNQDAGWGGTGALTFTAVSGTTYYLNVDGQKRQEGALKLTLGPVTAPPNDNHAGRLILPGLMPAAGGTVLGATPEGTDPAIPGATLGRSVWYEWTAPASGTALFRVVAQRFNPAVAIVTGNPGSFQTAVTSGTGAATTSEQTFLIGYPVNSGTVYKILIDGNPAENGEFRVSVSIPAPPANDAFASRAPLAGALVHASANNEGATKQTNEPGHAGSSPNASVWWEWTAPAAGPVAIDTSGSTAQARLAVYTGIAINALTPVASDTVVFPETFSNLNFTAAAGTKYVIAADSTDRQRGDITLNLVSGAAMVPNDSFAAAAVWNLDQAEALVRPLGASAEAGEPAHGGRPAARSVWWKWIPQTTRHARVWMQTQGNPLLARLVIYKGTALNSLTELSAQTTDGLWSRREVDVLAGETYYIVLDTPARAIDPGWIKLGIVPVNGTADNAFAITPGNSVVAANTTGAFNEDPALSPAALRQLWWSWTAEVNARMEWRVFVPAGSGGGASVSGTSASGLAVPGTGEIVATFDTAAGTTYLLKASTALHVPLSVQLVEAPRQVPPPNDVRYQAIEMAGASWSTPVTLGAETNDRLYWTWTAPSTGVAQVKLDGLLAETDALLAYADGNLDVTAGASSTNGGPPSLRLASVAGQQWTLVSTTPLRRLRAANLSLSPGSGTPPPNDSFLTPQVLSSSWASAPGDVTFASCQPGERDHSNSGGTGVATKLPPGRSVYYDWMPANSGPVTLRLDSAVPLAMRLYTGRTQDEWREEAFLMPGSRTLSTYLLAGQTYHIAVATRPYDEQTAAFTLRYGAASPNDMLAAAAVLSGASASASVDSTGATAESGEIGHGFNFETPRASLWWKWTAPSTGLVRIDTRGSEFDTILAVFSSDPPETTARVAENDNASSRPGVTASAVTFPAVSGQTYLIRICRKETTEATGLARLTLTMSALLDPFDRWLADWPTLTGASADETADGDGDGIPNLMELALGSNPTARDTARAALRVLPIESGVQVETTLDRDALEAFNGGTPLEIQWQLSRDMQTWQPGPPSQSLRREGRLSVEGIVLGPGDPPYARLSVRKAR